MSNSLDIIAWNLLDGINDPEIQRTVIDFGPDIAVFPEAHRESEQLLSSTVGNFSNAGYDVYPINYDDDDGRKDRHGLVVIARPEHVRRGEKIRMAGRNAIRLQLHEEAQFLGVHLDDRTELRRLDQARSAVRQLGDTAIVAGDFNALHGKTWKAALLRAAGPIANTLPSRDPVHGEKTPKLQRLGSLSQRLTLMAAGTTMATFEDAGFIDASRDHMPTKGPVEIDHILYRGAIAVAMPTVAESAPAVDHRLIWSNLIVN